MGDAYPNWVTPLDRLWVKFYPSGVVHRRCEWDVYSVFCGKDMWSKDRILTKKPSDVRFCKTCLKSLEARAKREDS